jgi:cation transport protein ChaC
VAPAPGERPRRRAARSRLALTPELVANIHRVVPDPGPRVGTVPLDDGDYDALVDGLLAPAHAADDVWLFAYGSLIWKPACEIAEQRPALLRGWHRSFCLRLTRFRGAPEFPGLMLALDRGGACRGVAQRLQRARAPGLLGQLLRREMSVKSPTNCPRWAIGEVDGKRRPLLAFTIDRAAGNYVGDLSIEATAAILARAVEQLGHGRRVPAEHGSAYRGACHSRSLLLAAAEIGCGKDHVCT